MQYVKPYTYLVGRPGGVQNLLLGSVAMLSTAVVPVLGQLMVMGWLAEVADDLDRDPDLREYPDFELRRFTQYLTRSIYPFVVQLLVSFLLLALLAVVGAVAVGAALLSNHRLVGLAVAGVLFVPAVFVAVMVMWPLTLHAQLSRGFAPGEALRFARAFLRTVGGQQALTLVIHFAISNCLSVVGLLCCFVGLYAAVMVQLAAQEHYLIQLYRLYLDEGGEPIRRADDGPREIDDSSDSRSDGASW